MTEYPDCVLVIEDDEDARANLRDILEMDAFRVEMAVSCQMALARTNWQDVGIIILDRRLPDGSAEELLPNLRELAPDAAVVIITGDADLDGVVAALREGAIDYLLKPVKPDLLRNTLQQIRQRQHLLYEKRRSEHAFRVLVEAANCMIVIVRQDRGIAYFNPFAEELTGFKASQVHGRSIDAVLVSAGPAVEGMLGRVWSEQTLRDVEWPVLCRDGSQAQLLWNLRLLPDYGGSPAVLAIGQDITSLKLAQTRALQAERLAAIGQMMAGLAHESRSALQRASSYLEMLELELGDRPEAIELVRRTQKAQGQLHKLYEEVRGYAAPIVPDLAWWPLAEIWREAWELLAPQRRQRDCRVVELAGTRGVICRVDRFRLVQVFRNLLENSLAATEGPVRVEIDCRPALLGEDRALEIVLRDNGSGLNRDQQQRIFEPFYTTKPQGTGLGMSIAQRIVEAHGGTLSLAVEQPAVGTELHLTLPAPPRS